MNKKALKSKTDVLTKIVIATKDIYDKASDEQKALMETLIGAGIWYLPNSMELYSGKISQTALDAITEKPNTKLVEEHSFPRKIAGRFLYDNAEKLKENPDYFSQKYVESFGRFNLVLKSENDKLKRYQKLDSFKSEIESYESAGIKLVDFSIEEYKEHKKHLRR